MEFDISQLKWTREPQSYDIKENKIPETFSYHAVLSSLKHLNAFIEQHGKEISFLSSALLDELVKQ